MNPINQAIFDVVSIVRDQTRKAEDETTQAMAFHMGMLAAIKSMIECSEAVADEEWRLDENQ